MSASPATFPPWIQEPLELGHLSPESAWKLEWELLVLQGQPWTPGVYEINQLVALHHWQPDAAPN
jgi:hypothetical protein